MNANANEFATSKARQHFSFHLLGDGKNVEIRMEAFNVPVEPGGWVKAADALFTRVDGV